MKIEEQTIGHQHISISQWGVGSQSGARCDFFSCRPRRMPGTFQPYIFVCQSTERKKEKGRKEKHLSFSLWQKEITVGNRYPE